ncbi:MAG: glycosyltransferase family 2 protein [Ignavibacteriales bacterium]|nr:glycosyltransferase family 2 protein [Ignavibacteriales bacterium]
MKRILVAIPVLNEAESLGAILDRVRSIKIRGARLSVLVVDDGSTDGSATIAKGHGAALISHGANRGLGAAFRSAVRYALASGVDVMATIDGDGQFDPNDLPKLINPILEDQSDFVTASRFRTLEYVPVMPKIKFWGNRRIAQIVNRLAGTALHDVSCGFRAYSRESLLALDLIGDFTYTHEVILTLAFRGIRMMEVDVKVRGSREHGESRVAGSIVRYALLSSLILLRNFRDYRPLAIFGIPAIVVAATGILCLFYFSISSIILQEFYPKVLAFIGAFMLLFATILSITALLADMFTRIRMQLEETKRNLLRLKR